MTQSARTVSIRAVFRTAVLAITVFAVSAFFTPSADAAPKKHKSTSVTKSKGKKGKKGKRGKKSRKNRTYNPELTREQAEEIIRNNSAFISELAGLEPGAQLTAHTLDGASVDSVLLQEGENIAELEREDDVPVDLDNMETLSMLLDAFTGVSGISDLTESGIRKKDLMDRIMRYVGTPYRFGGMNAERGIDCSAFTQFIYYKSGQIVLPRTARDQISIGQHIDREELEFGDLIFFHTYSKVFASHVGIYLGDDLFAHASSRYGVTVSSLNSTYYATRFIGGRRLTPIDVDRLSVNAPEDEAQSEQ